MESVYRSRVSAAVLHALVFRVYSAASKGFKSATPAFRKSWVFLVAMVSPRTNAVAAIRLSLTGMAGLFFRRRAGSLAHSESGVRVELQHTQTLDSLREPEAEPSPSPAGRQQQD